MTTTNELDRLLAPRIVKKKVPPKILTLDIERLPGRATVKHRGLTISGDFWDLSGWKHTLGYRIKPEDVEEWPRTICLAWRWYGARKVEFSSEWDDGHEGMLRQAWDLYNEAQVVVGHNIDGFDTKKLKGEWNLYRLGRPSPFKSVDTLKVARSEFGYESNTLDSLLTRWGLQGKTDKYSIEMARAACAGDPRAQRKLRLYNQGDIRATENAYDFVRGWIPNHPHIGLLTGDEDCCGNCGGDLVQNDWYRTAVTAYAQMHCTNCGAWFRKTHIKARVTTRPAR